MKAVFIELPAFERNRSLYLNEEDLEALQLTLMKNPEAGNVIQGTGGLRKLRFTDPRRSKGTRGGLRMIYFYWDANSQFWLFTLYDKDEATDLTPKQRQILKLILKTELEKRS